MSLYLEEPKVTIGGDPECFVYDTNTGRPVDASFIPMFGTKEKPVPFQHPRKAGKGVPGDGIVGRVHPDGFLAEWTVAPATSREYFTDYMQLSIFNTIKMLPPSLMLDCSSPIVKLTDEELEWLHEESKKFGCEPDICAHGDPGSEPRDASKISIRCAGDHIHLGIGVHPREAHDRLAIILDKMVGVPAMLLAADPDGERVRREYYGKAGSYRIKTKERTGYDGHEYRSLSCSPLVHPMLFNFVYGQARVAAHIFLGTAGNRGECEAFLAAMDGIVSDGDARTIINSFDLTGAKEVTDKLMDLKFWDGAGTDIPWADKDTRAAFHNWGKNGLSSKLVSHLRAKQGGLMYNAWRCNEDFSLHQDSQDCFEDGFADFAKQVANF